MRLPFLTYLTVFKSRLGVCNAILDLTGFAHVPAPTLTRKLKALLSERTQLALEDSDAQVTLEYLVAKNLVGKRLKKRGRYTGLTLTRDGEDWTATDKTGSRVDTVSAQQTDVWMSDPSLRSTIGVPTPDNAEEAVDLAIQLRLLTRAKNTWTAAGQLVQALRRKTAPVLPDPSNPFVLGGEAVAYLRQMVAVDGLMLRELLRVLPKSGERVSRDDIAREFPRIVGEAVAAARDLRLPPPVRTEISSFKKLVEATAAKRGKQSRAPGVLEHRTAPRLEWLVDLGYLEKSAAAKNSFEYEVLPTCAALLRDLDEHAHRLSAESWPESVALLQWRSNPLWKRFRAEFRIEDQRTALCQAYRILKRAIGPSPIREVALLTAMLHASSETYDRTVANVLEYASATDGVSLAGGRYQRTPQNIFISDRVLEEEP